MQYRSPVFPFSDSFLESPGKKGVQLERKRLLADLELSEESCIMIRNATFYKNDIIQYCDALANDIFLEYHAIVFRDKVLVNFLETGMLPSHARFLNNELYSDPLFIDWISPYFASSFQLFLQHCFVETDDGALIALLNNHLLMTTAATEECWRYTEKVLIADGIEALHAYCREENTGLFTHPNSISHLMEFSHIRIVQLLPPQRFDVMKNRYALVMMEACIKMSGYATNYKDKAVTFIENAKILATDEKTKHTINIQKEQLYLLQEHRKRAWNKKSTIVRLIWLIIYLILYIALSSKLIAKFGR